MNNLKDDACKMAIQMIKICQCVDNDKEEDDDEEETFENLESTCIRCYRYTSEICPARNFLKMYNKVK